MRWLYHILRRASFDLLGDYAPPSLASEGFVHCSYRPAVRESAALYFAADAPDALAVLQIDPRLLGGLQIDVAATPRGPMPHVQGPIPLRAIVSVRALADFAEPARAPDDLDP